MGNARSGFLNWSATEEALGAHKRKRTVRSSPISAPNGITCLRFMPPEAFSAHLRAPDSQTFPPAMPVIAAARDRIPRLGRKHLPGAMFDTKYPAGHTSPCPQAGSPG